MRLVVLLLWRVSCLVGLGKNYNKMVASVRPPIINKNTNISNLSARSQPSDQHDMHAECRCLYEKSNVGVDSFIKRFVSNKLEEFERFSLLDGLEEIIC